MEGEDYPNIPGYKVQRMLGKGGMGAVYEAVQVSLDRKVALKVMLPVLSAVDSSFAARFIREAKQTAKLKHPNIVTIHETGNVDGQLYMAIEFVEGGSLADLLERGSISDERIIRIMRETASALQLAHDNGLIHRDIKPDNILLETDGQALIADFGIVKTADSSPKITDTMGVIGSPSFMSPEQIKGEELDGRADLYSLGVVLFEMLEGRAPFEGKNNHAIQYQHLSAKLPRFKHANARLVKIAKKLLAKNRDNRYVDAHALLGALARCRPKSAGLRPPTSISPAAQETRPSAANSYSETVAQVPERRFFAGLLLALIVAGLLTWLWSKTGQVVPPDEPIQRSLYELASNVEFQQGNGPRAYALYLQSAKEGDTFSQAAVARLLFLGRGVAQDKVAAIYWSDLALLKLLSLADDRVAEAMFLLAALYQYGIGVPLDVAEAFALNLEAAENGYPVSQRALGAMYGAGAGVAKSEEEALKWYRAAAQGGNVQAQVDLAIVYAIGEGVDKDYLKAVDWYRQAATQGHARGQYGLGLMYANGEGVENNDLEAVKWYRLSAEQGYAFAQTNLGKMYAVGRGMDQDDVEAAKLYALAAQQEDAMAQNLLGVMYANGQGVAKNDKRAVEWYRKGAEHGLASAQKNLGYMYDRGLGIPKNDEKAATWYLKAAQQGDAVAQANLGFLYASGRGISKSDSDAVNWYRKGAAQGNANAQTNLGYMYAHGRGVIHDDSEAVNWYRRAAMQGHAQAQYNLGVRYSTGSGVEHDDKQALEWFRKAAAQEHASAKAAVARLQR